MSLEIDVRFPSSFPYAPKECKAVAEPFFNCFTTKAVKVVPEDADAGRRGARRVPEQIIDFPLRGVVYCIAMSNLADVAPAD
eukprot:gene34373-38854_t